ncbi:MAG: cell division protein ZapA [Rhizomicrobium sp.]
MPLVNIMVNNRAYTIACDEGEEDHLRELAAHVDGKVRELLQSVGQVGDARLILMAALLITDDYFDSVTQLEKRARQLGDLSNAQEQINERLSSAENGAIAALEAAAKRAEDIAARLAQA